jgi:hypothetical protein
LSGFGGVSYSPNTSILISQNLRNLEGDRKGMVPFILKRFELSILLLQYKFIFISLNLINDGHNCQFILPSPPLTTSKQSGEISILLSLLIFYNIQIRGRDNHPPPLSSPSPHTIYSHLSQNFQTYHKVHRA